MNIKGAVEKLIKKYNTNDPFHLCRELDIAIYYEDLGNILGFYDVHFRIKSIHLNTSLPEHMLPFVCVHELGHARLHPALNTPFLSKYTLFSIDKIEKQANRFAVELLLPDSLLEEYNSINFNTLSLSKGIPAGLEQLKERR